MADGVIDDGRKLPRGRHGLPRGVVIEHQRQRLIRAVAPAARAKGFSALTVEDISVGAGVSRRTFYDNFRDKQDCFITAYCHYADELLNTVVVAAAAGTDWRERGRFALAALLRYFAERPDVAHMGVIEVMAAGPAALAERDRAVLALSALIADGALPASPARAPTLLQRAIAGAVLQLIYAQVQAEHAAELEDLLPVSTYMLLVALDGPAGAAARAGLAAPGQSSPRHRSAHQARGGTP
jgi:AcrR family transcriptional regulator